MKGGKFLASGTYGCAYYPSLRCFGEDERKDLVSKIMTKQDALEELKKEEEIRKIDPNQEFSIYTVSSCVPGNIDKDEDNSLKDCHSRVISQNDFDTKNNMWKNDLYMLRDNFRVGDMVNYYIESERNNLKGNITKINDDGLIDIETVDGNDVFLGINPKYITHVGRKQYLLLFKKFGGPPISSDYFNSINIETLYLPLLELIKGIDILGRNNLIHQDIKCDNILYNLSENKFYLIDFGLQVFKSEAFQDSNENIKTYEYFPFPIDWLLSSKIDYYRSLSKRIPDWENKLKINIGYSIIDRWNHKWGRDAGILDKDYMSIRDTLIKEFKEIILDESGNLDEEYRKKSVDKLDIFSLGMVFYKIQNYSLKDTNAKRQQDFIQIVEKMKSHSLKERYDSNECLADYTTFLKKYNLISETPKKTETKKIDSPLVSEEYSSKSKDLSEPLNPIEEEEEECAVRHLINSDGSTKKVPCYPIKRLRDNAIEKQFGQERNIDCENEAKILRDIQLECMYNSDGELIESIGRDQDIQQDIVVDSRKESPPKEPKLRDSSKIDIEIIDNFLSEINKSEPEVKVDLENTDVYQLHETVYKNIDVFKNKKWIKLPKVDGKTIHPELGVYIRNTGLLFNTLIKNGIIII